MTGTKKDQNLNGLIELLTMVALRKCVDSLDRDMQRFGGDGNKMFDAEDLTVDAVMTVARHRVRYSLKALDEDDSEVAAKRAENTDADNRLADNISNWVEGFLVGARWSRASMEIDAEMAQEAAEKGGH